MHQPRGPDGQASAASGKDRGYTYLHYRHYSRQHHRYAYHRYRRSYGYNAAPVFGAIIGGVAGAALARPHYDYYAPPPAYYDYGGPGPDYYEE